MRTFSDLFQKRIVILDGGLGTTLEQRGTNISHTPLWSAKAVHENPDAIVETHLSFLRAGARILSTSTYQCSFRSFERAGFTRVDAINTMKQSVYLAAKARLMYLSGLGSSLQSAEQNQVVIALSLGPFGACLSPAQEFDGVYPPPYGPKAYSDVGGNVNSFGTDSVGEVESIEALARFHYERLMVFADDLGVWDAIDCIAFETVPLVREARAIRVAMGRLTRTLAENAKNPAWKPWWVTSVFPSGECLESGIDGKPLTVEDLVSALWSDSVDDPAHLANNPAALPSPNGVGINCTLLKYYSSLVNEFQRAIHRHPNGSSGRPWLVLYPNGGDTYDPISQTWETTRDHSGESVLEWADTLTRILGYARGFNFWGGIIVGGCCRTGPEDIAALRAVVPSG